MSEQLLIQLTRLSFEKQAVASCAIGEGINLLVYPLGESIVVGVGFPREQAHKINVLELLRRRSAALSQHGKWLPAVLSDGSVYLLRKVTGVDRSYTTAALSQEVLQSARELLS